jgi:hypothetical protein
MLTKLSAEDRAAVSNELMTWQFMCPQVPVTCFNTALPLLLLLLLLLLCSASAPAFVDNHIAWDLVAGINCRVTLVPHAQMFWACCLQQQKNQAASKKASELTKVN